jgi:hypothetical protein
MKEGSLFDLFVTLKSPKPWCVLSCFWCPWKVFNVSTYSEEVFENKNFMKIHLNEANYNGIWAHFWYC